MSCNHPVGTACHCNPKGACFTRYQISSENGQLEFKNGDVGMRTLTLIDKGDGCKVDIAIEGTCSEQKPSCPSGYLTDNADYSVPLSSSECKTYTLHYRALRGEDIGLLGAIQNLLAENKATSLPCTSYQVCVTQCAGKPQTQQPLWLTNPIDYLLGAIPSDSFIDVYPKLEIESKITLSYSSPKTELTDEQRYAEYLERQRSGLRSGSSIPTEEIKKQFTLSGGLIITQGSTKTEYSSSSTHSNSNLIRRENIQTSFENIRDQWLMISGILNIIEQLKNGTYQNEGAEKINLVSLDFKPPTISLTGKQTTEVVNSQLATSGNIELGFKPLFNFSMTLDLVLAAAAYFKMERAVAEIREQAVKLEQKVNDGEMGAYVGAEFFVALETQLDATGSVTHKANQPAAFDLSTVAGVQIKATANVRGGAKVWIVEGAFQLVGEVIAEGKCALRSKLNDTKPNVKLIFFHEGIKAKVEVTLTAKIKSKDDIFTHGTTGRDAFSSDVSAESKVSQSVKKEWIWAKALSETDSPYHTTLIGA